MALPLFDFLGGVFFVLERLSRNTTKWFSVLFWGADIHAQARTKNTGV